MKKIVLFLLLIPIFLQAETIKILNSDSDALQARFDLIREAREEILISYFIFGDDDTALQFLAEIREAVRRKVKVKILIDAPFNHIPKEIITYLTLGQVEMKVYNKMKLFKLGEYIKYRMHDKIFLVDGEHLILGGRNIENEYYGFGDRNFVDRDIYIKGDLAQEARDYFLELFEASHVSLMKTYKNIPHFVKYKQKKAIEILDNAYAQLDDHYYLNPGLIKDWRNNFFEIDDVDFFHDEVGLKEKYFDKTTQEIIKLLKNAKESIIIDSPYLILNRELIHIFQEAIQKRNVKIRILTNSLYSNDVALPQADYLNYRKRLQNIGIELYEYYSYHTLHSKSFVIDGKISMIGSFNIDPRSYNLNTETYAIVKDVTFAESLLTMMDLSIEKTYKIGSDGKPIGHKVANPGVKKRKVFFTNLLRKLFIPYIRNLL